VHAAAHESGHWKAASKEAVKLAPPIFIPAGLGIIGSFGAITGIKGILKNRSQVLKIAAAGPLYGAAAAGVVTVIGLALSAASVGPSVPVWPTHSFRFLRCILYMSGTLTSEHLHSFVHLTTANVLRAKVISKPLRHSYMACHH
jgi:Zn-dependent protease